jgi:hypothetical protein
MLVTVRNITMRDGPEGFEIRSQAEIVEVGEDGTGKTLTSLVITETDAPAGAGGKRRGRTNIGGSILNEALRAALSERGAIFRPSGANAAEYAVNETEVRARFETSYPTGETDAHKKIDAMRHAYKRALQTAVAEGIVGKAVRDGVDVLWFKAPQKWWNLSTKCRRNRNEVDEIAPKGHFVDFVDDPTKWSTKCRRNRKGGNGP